MAHRAAVLLVLLAIAALAANALEYTVTSSDVISNLGRSTSNYPAGSPATRSPKFNIWGEQGVWEFLGNPKKDSDFKNVLLTFTPFFDGDFFTFDVCSTTSTTYPVSPTEEVVGMVDDTFATVRISNNTGPIPFFLLSYDTIYFNDDGLVTFGEPVWGGGFCIAPFFSAPSAAALYANLDPGRPKTKIFLDENEDLGYVAVTFQNVRCNFQVCKGKARKPQSFQMVFYNTGVIQFYYKTPLRLNAQSIVGVSPESVLSIPSPVDFDAAPMCV